MNKTLIRSGGAVAAGFVFTGVTHSACDFLMEHFGILPKGNLYVSTALIWVVIGYRAVLSLGGTVITAALAPHSPLKHALILGAIGTVLSVIGAVAMADRGPLWYGWTIAAMALPISYAGAKLLEAWRAKRSDAAV